MKAIVMIMVLAVFSAAAMAAVLPLSAQNVKDGTIVEGNTTYNIVYFTQTYLRGGGISSRIVVENQDDIRILEAEAEILRAKVGGINDEYDQLRANASEIGEMRQSIAMAMDLVKQQQEVIAGDIEALREEKKGVDDVLTGNVVMSPTAFRAALIIFVLLLILVIAANTTGIFSKGRPREKTPYEDDEF